MSRLDSFIRRICAQRSILNELPAQLDAIPGLILEFGLGSGRTYDHLREHFPTRRVVVFESVVIAHPKSCPAPDDLVTGDLRETTTRFSDGCAALIHADIETGLAECDAELRTWLPDIVARLLVPGGYAASGSALPHPDLAPQPLPGGIADGRYHLVRRV